MIYPSHGFGFLGLVRTALLVLLPTCALHGEINLELRPESATAGVGNMLDVGLYAVSDDPDIDQALVGAQAIVQWNAADLRLIGPMAQNAGDWILAGFFDDSQGDGLNTSFDDGNAYYQAASALPGPAWATPDGLLVTTFQFEVLRAAMSTQLTLVPDYGEYAESAVFGNTPGADVTGSLSSTVLALTPQPDWGVLQVQPDPGTPCVRAGDTITFTLSVSGLLEPINAVQALVQYDRNLVELLDVLPGDGMGSDWDSATQLQSDINGGMALLAILFGAESQPDAAICRVRFFALADAAPDLIALQLVPQTPQLTSTLTVAATGVAIVPNLTARAVVPRCGDANANGLIDLSDMSGYVGCMSGPGAPATPACACFDLDADGFVDLAEFAVLQNLFNGP